MNALFTPRQLGLPEVPAAAPAPAGFAVICLCAEWCGTCREYRPGFAALAAQFPQVEFGWLDIEERADALGDLDIEDFPTLLVVRGDLVLFFGPMRPHVGHLRRMVETFLEQSPEESRDYAGSSPERKKWQTDADLRGVATNWRRCQDD